MKDTLKRLTCMLLALIMVAGMFPVSVFAEAENPISVDAGSTVSNVIGPIGAPEESQEPVVQTPVEEVVEEPTEVVPETPAFDPAEPIKYQVENAKTFSVLDVLVGAGAPVNAITNLTGELAGKSDATPINGDWRLTPYNYFDSVELSITAKNAPDGEEAVYTVILSNPDPNAVVEEKPTEEPAEVTIEEAEEPAEEEPVPMPAATLTATVDNTVITVEAPEGAFPEGIQLSAAKADPEGLLVAALKEIGYSAAEAPEIAQAIIDSGADLSAYIQNFTLTFYLPEQPDKHIEPAVEVEVTFENLTINTDEVAAFHNDGTSVDKLEADANGTDVTISVPVFSDNGIADLVGLRLLAAGATPEFDSAEDMARYYYSAESETRIPTMNVSVTGGDTSVYAGTTFSLNLSYSVSPSLSYAYSFGSRYLFDNYEDAKITFTLPEGLHLVIPTNKYSNSGIGDVVQNGQTYTLYIGDAVGTLDSTHGSKQGQLQLTVFVEDNGVLGINVPFDLSDMPLEISGKFHIDTYDLDHQNTPNPDAPNTLYNAITNATGPEDVISDSPDFWGVKKELYKKNSTTYPDGYPDGYVVNPSKTEVTIYYAVSVGLVDSAGEVIFNGGSYLGTGRVPLTSALLSDTLFELKDRDNNTINPTNLTIYKYVTGQTPAPKTLQSGIAVDLSPANNLALNTVGTNDNGVDPSAPTLTTYIVAATYPYEKFIAEYYADNQAPLTVEDEALLTYRRKGETTDRQASDDEQVAIGEVTTPAALNVTKYIEKYNTAVAPYLAKTSNGFTGTYSFTVWKQDGTAATLYTRSGNSRAYTYTKLVDENDNPINTIVIDLSTGITDTYYLDPGIYLVKEVATGVDDWVTIPSGNTDGKTSDHAIEREETYQFTFTNKEKLGEFTVDKVDEANKALAGATIKVYTDPACDEEHLAKDAAGADLIGTIGASGTITFTRVKYGTYYVKETQAPNGYIIDNTVHTVDVDENYNGLAHIKFTNVKNSASLNLSKKISTTTAAYGNLTSTYTSAYAGKFKLQKNEGTGWVDVETINSVSAGAINYTKSGLPIYVINADGTQGSAIQYRIVETIPDGWRDEENNVDAGGTVISDPVTLTTVNSSGVTVASDKTITFKDRKLAKVTVNKEFFKLGTDGNMAKDTAATEQVTVTLFKKVGSGNYTQVTVASPAANPATFTGSYTWENLKLFEGAGDAVAAVTYYVKESEISGYALTTAANSDGYVPVTMSNTNGTVTLQNVQQKVAIKIVKKDANTGLFVSDSVVSVIQKNSSDETVTTKLYNPSTGAEVPSTGIAIIQEGNLFWVEPGFKYTAEETATKEGYTFASATTADLTGITTVPANQQVMEIVVTNQSDPSLKIKKNLKYVDAKGAKTDTITTAEFDLYYVDNDNNIVPYTTGNPAVQVHITGDTAVQVKEGTYYVHETNATAFGAVDPDQHPEVYGFGTTDSKVIELETSSGKIYLFGPITVENQTGSDNVTEFTVDNTKNTGNVTVIKKNWRSKQPMAKAILGIRETSASEVPTGTKYRQETPATGLVTFFDFPVYDANGELISYTITEITAPLGYYQYSPDLVTTLVAGQTITTVNGAAQTTDPDNTLVVYNDKLVGFNVAKDHFNAWEYQSTHKAYALPGTTVAIYEQLENGSYKLVTDEDGNPYNNVQTGSYGNVKVEGLNPNVTYVAVEVAIPTGDEYQYLHPTSVAPDDGPPYDEKAYLTPVPETLTETQLAQYNYVKRDSISPDATEAQVEAWEDAVFTLHNVEDWAQIDVTKYKAKYEYIYNEQGEPVAIKQPVNIDEPQSTPETSDHAIFRLYKQVINPATVGSTLTFNENNCEFIEEYTSGTYYNLQTGSTERVPGRFATDVLDCDPTLVYWLIEVKPEPGTVAITNATTNGTSNKQPGNQTVTLYHHPSVPVTNTGGRTMSYLRNEVTYDSIDNALPPPGPGDGLRYASIRLSKWAARLVGYAFDTNTYDPLANVTFNLYLCDETGVINTSVGDAGVIDVITVGLDSAGYASGQSADFCMTTKTRTDEETGDVEVYVNSFSIGMLDLDPALVQSETDGDHTNYFFYVGIREASAPAEFIYDPDYYYEKVYFLDDGTGDEGEWTFNDAYLVINANKGSESLAVDTQGSNQVNAHLGDAVSGPFSYSVGNQYNRIVNYPVVKSPVVVRKYGYIVNDANLGKNSDELDTYYTTVTTAGRTKLAGVKMRLEKFDETIDGWYAYDYTDNLAAGDDTWKAEFTTDSNGIFRFVGGLNTGRYRIKELDLGDANRDAYENAYGEWGDQYYRYFTVSANRSKTVTMYNPAKATIKVLKKNGDGEQTLTGHVFALDNLGSEVDPVAEWSSTDKTTYFYNLPTGTYQLSEPTPPTGYSNAYLQTYFHTEYTADPDDPTASLYAFADDSTGTWFGNVIAGEQHDDDVYDYGTVVTKYRNAAQVAITVIDPLLVKLTILKTDDGTTPKPLEGAEFTVYRQNFDKTSDAVTPDDSKWEAVTGSPFTTDGNGQIVIENLVPGFYKLEETGVPEDFELIGGKDTWLVALTGGLPVTVTGMDYSDTDATAEYTIKNREQAGVGIKKVFTENALTQDFDWSAEFVLGTYNAETQTMTSIETITLNQDDPDKNFTTALSQGSDYYITESANSAYNFSSFKVKVGETETEITETVVVGGVTWYKFKATSAEELTVTAENISLYAEIEIEKRDKDIQEKLLSGAKFKLVKVDGTTETVVTEDFTELEDEEGNGIGKYVVSFLMDSTAPATYRIYETKAPDGYLLDETQYAEVRNITPGQHVTTGYVFLKGASGTGTQGTLYLNNEGGFTIELTKLSNIYGSEVLDPVSGATFTLLRWDAENRTWVKFGKDQDCVKTTGNDGKVTFVAQNGAVYGLAETAVPDGYTALESIHVVTGSGTDQAVSADPLTPSPTKFGDYTVYLLNGGSSDWTVGETYLFNAYNVPKVGFQVRKRDVSESGILPIAVYNVYRVENQLDLSALAEQDKAAADAIAAQILAGTYSGAERIVQDQITDQGKSSDSAYSYRNVTGVEAGYTYVVIETAVAAFDSSKTYDSLAKDDIRVKWYGSIYIEEGAVTDYETMYVMLDNVLGKATVDLTKTAEEPTVDRTTLFAGDQTVTYTVTPSVTNSMGLESFTVNDTGLTAYHVVGNVSSKVYDTDTDSDGTLDAFQGYSLKTVAIASPTHDPSIYGVDVNDAPIVATVEFYGFDGALLDTKTLSAGESYTTTAGDVKEISVSYAVDPNAAGAQTLNSKGYVLGKDFKPGDITITALLKKHQDGPTVYTIDKIHNDSDTLLEYRPSDANGDKLPQAISAKADADIDILFKQPEIPVIEVTKSPEAQLATLDGTFSYVISMKNKTEGLALANPFVIDLLPKGTDFISAELLPPVGSLGTLTDRKFVQGELGAADAMTAVMLSFNDVGAKLEGNTTAKIKITIKINSQVEIYGENIKNYVFMSTAKPTYKSTDNPTGAPFKDDKFDDEYARTIPNVGATLSPVLSSADANALVNLLGDGSAEIGTFGYVAHSVQTPWSADAKVDPVKTIRADQDTDSNGNLLEFSTTRLAQASNGAADPSEDGGWVEYQLALTNTSDLTRTSAIIADILPQPGDTQDIYGSTRQSAWKVTFNKIESVIGPTAHGNSGATYGALDYKVYGYSGAVEQAYIAINEALDVWKASNNYDNPGFDSKWTQINASQPNTEITAFLIITKADYQLRTNEHITATLMTDVLYYGDTVSADGTPAFSSVAYLNNTNNFVSVVWDVSESTGQPTGSSPTITSNVVSATLMPDEVQVGGNVWIDADDNGLQDDGPFSVYTNDAIVKLLMNDVTVNLNTYNNKNVGRTYPGGVVTRGFVYDNKDGFITDETSPNVKPATYVGEPEFLFTHLKSALMMGTNPYNENGDLNVQYLRGEAPSTYIMDFGISDAAANIFQLAKHARTDYWKSDDPENMPAEARTDCNFDRLGGLTSFYNERFYLFPTSTGDLTDMTKDIGFVPFRDLTITKVAEDDQKLLLDEAQFTIYGPYKRDTVTKNNYDPSILDGKSLGVIETYEGEAYKTHLLWYKDYIIVETKAPDGYILDGEIIDNETTEGTNIEKLADNTWILRVPDTTSTNTSEGVTITNPRGVPDVPFVEKIIDGKPIQDETFKFILDFDASMTDAEKANVKFKDVDDVDGDKDTDEYIAFTAPQTKILTVPAGTSNKKEAFFDASTTVTENTIQMWFLVPGTYKFVIEEVAQSSSNYNPADGTGTWAEDPNFTYDGSKWLYEVTVSIDPTSKELVASHTYTKINSDPVETADQAEFKNEYAVYPVDEHLKVTKEILPEGTTLPAGLPDAEFEFTLEAVDGAPLTLIKTGTDGTQTETPTTPLVVTIKASEVANGKVADFGDITFTAVGEYKYTITETDKSDVYPWFEFNTTPVTATVNVIDDPDNPGHLKVVHPITYSSSKTVEQATDTTPEIAAALIKNTYVPGKVNFEVGAKKIFQSYTNDSFTFEFTLYKVADDGTETKLQTIAIENVSGNPTSGQTTTATKLFTAVELEGKGTFKFKIDETAYDEASGVVKVTNAYTYEVTTDWVNGKLTITDVKKNGKSVTDTTAEFINKYDLEAVWTPKISKTLTGRKMTDDDVFTFTVKEGTKLVATGKANKDGIVTITYLDADGHPLDPQPQGVVYTLADAGTHVYTIKEDKGGDTSIGYSTQTITATVVVKEQNKKLIVSDSYSDDPEFINTFEADGEWTPKAYKTMEGRDMLDKEVFNFEVKEVNGENETLVMTGTASGGTNGQPVNIVWDPAKITYNQDDLKDDNGEYIESKTYTYKITEVAGSAPGVTYSTDVYTATVTVALEKNADGTYKDKLKVTYNDPTSHTFTNPYDHEPISIVPPVKKTISNQVPVKDATFTFNMVLTSKNGQNVSLDKDGTKTLVDNTIPDVELTLGANDVITKTGYFSELWFLDAGTYTFTVKETAVSDTQHYKKDVSEWTLTATVTDNTTTGKLEVSWIYTMPDSEGTGTVSSTVATFDNPYTSEPVEDLFHVTKLLEGEPLFDPSTTFKFVMADEGSNDSTGYVMPADRTVTISGTEAKQGKIADFAKIKFVKPNTGDDLYVFTIREEDTGAPSGPTSVINYDPTIWYVKVKVENNNDKLEIATGYPKYYKGGSDESSLTNYAYAAFTNTYIPGETTYTPEVTKIVDGEPRPTENCKQDFWFDLTFVSATYANPDGKVGYTMDDPVRVKVHDAGTSTFGTITFTKIGTYVFMIQEEDGTEEEKKVYTFDTVPRYLTVEVTDGGQGKLVRTFHYSRGNSPEEAKPVADATMINIYQPLPVEYKPPVEKTIITKFGPTVAEKIFKFELLAMSGKTDGSDMPNGTKKTLEIHIQAGQTSLPDPQPTFDAITYKKAGTYTYQITETVSGEEGITDSTKSWTLTVVVEDINRQLTVTSHAYVPDSGSGNAEQAEFENTYKPEPTVFTPKATKTLTVDFGPTVASKFFDFVLKLKEAFAADGTTVVKDGASIQNETKTVEVKAGETVGEQLFSEITFSKAGTYTYTITEKPSGEEGITEEDTAEKTLVIVVTDKDGALYISKYTYSTGETKSAGPDDTPLTGLEEDSLGNEVTNVYEPTPTKYPPQVTKNITVEYGPTVAEKIFKFDIECTSAVAADGTTDVTDGQVKSVDSKPYEAYDFAGATIEITVPAGKTVGTLTFDEIYYTKAGTYTYKITEKVSGEEGITDDTAEWELVVEVTDKDGRLEVTNAPYTSSDTTVPVSDSTATFVNPYKPEPTEYAPQVIKNIDLVTGAPTSLDKTFKFDLEFISATAMDGFTDVSDGQLDAAEDAGGKQFVSDSVVITVPAGEVTGGPASFMTIHFTKAGKYSYRITEEELLPPELGMAYDGSVWILTVTVTDTDGKLEVTGTSYTNDPTVAEVSNEYAEFVNPYRTGNLRVEKHVSGNGASTMTKFTFKVVLYTEELFTGIRTPLAGEYPVEIYDRKGNLIDTATVVDGTVTFKLRHSEYAIIKNVPIGVKWEVEEEKYTGYSTSVETPNKGTIGLMESVSKWKNHRSTVPPIPRTGYGDGTTVKVGLGTSLGVFLASAIGSILRSKNSKKKKRGGGSHAAN